MNRFSFQLVFKVRYRTAIKTQELQVFQLSINNNNVAGYKFNFKCFGNVA